MTQYFIRANVYGKKMYWECERGLHCARGQKRGFQIFKTEKEAKEVIKHLKKCFVSGITWEVLPDSEIPFIKKQHHRKK